MSVSLSVYYKVSTPERQMIEQQEKHLIQKHIKMKLQKFGMSSSTVSLKD